MRLLITVYIICYSYLSTKAIILYIFINWFVLKLINKALQHTYLKTFHINGSPYFLLISPATPSFYCYNFPIMWRSFLVCNPSIYLKRLGSSVARSPLAQLRKRTNLPLNKCKEALVNCDNDVVTAEKWLLEKAEKEGWLKAEKLSGRDATQGYVGVMVQRNRAVLTEVSLQHFYRTFTRNLIIQAVEGFVCKSHPNVWP